MLSLSFISTERMIHKLHFIHAETETKLLSDFPELCDSHVAE